MTTIKHIRSLLLFVTMLFGNSGSQAQVVHNTGVFITVGSGTVAVLDTILLDLSASLSNDGIMDVAKIQNSGTVQGNGSYNVSSDFTNFGTFTAGNGTVNYNGSGDQSIAPLDYYNLSIAQNGSRTISFDSSGTIGISNAFITAAGSTAYMITGSTLNFNGSANQNIPAFSYYNLILDNPAGGVISGTTTVAGTLKAATGNLTTGGFLTLLSDATQTSAIDGTGNGEVLGPLTMQRYLSSGLGYKYFSSPFQAATVNEFADELNLSSTFPPLFHYDENLVSSGWAAYTNTSDLLNPMEGYAADLGSSSVATTVDMTGVVNNGNLTSTWYNHNRSYTHGFNLAGNPYPSTIDWDAPGGWTRVNIDNALYFFNASSTDQYAGTYSTYINGISSDGIASGLIAPMQGFFIHVSDGSYPVSATLGINNTARTTGLRTHFYRQAHRENQLFLRLEASFPDAGMQADHAVVYSDDSATKDFDRSLDAFKLMNTDTQVPCLYTITSNGDKLSINAIPALTDSTRIVPLGLKTAADGWVRLLATDFKGVPPGMHVYLSDYQTGMNQDLLINPGYRISVQAGVHETRLKLIFTYLELPNTGTLNIFSAYSLKKKIYITLSPEAGDQGEMMICNMQGQICLRQTLHGAGEYELESPAGTGIYILNYRWEKGVQSQKIIVGIE